METDRRGDVRRPTQARMMLKVGLDHTGAYGFCTVVDISMEGLKLLPDRGQFHVYRDFQPGKTVIMVGIKGWVRHFSLSGSVRWIRPINTRPHPACYDYDIDDGHYVGVRIASTTNDHFLRAWVENAGDRAEGTNSWQR